MKFDNPLWKRWLLVLAALSLLVLSLVQRSQEQQRYTIDQANCKEQVIRFFGEFGLNDPRGSYNDTSPYWTNMTLCLMDKCLAKKGYRIPKGSCTLTDEMGPMYNAFQPKAEVKDKSGKVQAMKAGD